MSCPPSALTKSVAAPARAHDSFAKPAVMGGINRVMCEFFRSAVDFRPEPRNVTHEQELIIVAEHHISNAVSVGSKDLYCVIVDKALLAEQGNGNLEDPRVFRHPNSIERYGNVEQPHLSTFSRASVVLKNLMAVHRGSKDSCDFDLYNVHGSIDTIRLRALNFAVVNGQLTTNTRNQYSRYSVWYFEILKTATPDALGRFGYADQMYLAMEGIKVAAKTCGESFLEKCSVEMGADRTLTVKIQIFLVALDTFNVISSMPNRLEGLDTEKIHSIFRTDFCDKKILIEHTKSEKWFSTGGRMGSGIVCNAPSGSSGANLCMGTSLPFEENSKLIKCQLYPHRHDFSGNRLTSGDHILLGLCTRPRITLCPYCGFGSMGELATHNIFETMLRREICSQSTFKIIETKGTVLLEGHMSTCPHKDSNRAQPPNRTKGKSFYCFSCHKRFQTKLRWKNHCSKRLCVVGMVRGLLRGPRDIKRKHEEIDRPGNVPSELRVSK